MQLTVGTACMVAEGILLYASGEREARANILESRRGCSEGCPRGGGFASSSSCGPWICRALSPPRNARCSAGEASVWGRQDPKETRPNWRAPGGVQRRRSTVESSAAGSAAPCGPEEGKGEENGARGRHDETASEGTTRGGKNDDTAGDCCFFGRWWRRAWWWWW